MHASPRKGVFNAVRRPRNDGGCVIWPAKKMKLSDGDGDGQMEHTRASVGINSACSIGPAVRRPGGMRMARRASLGSLFAGVVLLVCTATTVSAAPVKLA